MNNVEFFHAIILICLKMGVHNVSSEPVTAVHYLVHTSYSTLQD